MPYKVQSAYPGAKVLKDFISANAAYVAGTYTDIGNIAMGALQSLQVGRGTHTGQQSAIGRMYAKLEDTSTTPVSLSGRVRLQVYDPNGVPVANGLLLDERTEAIAEPASGLNRNEMFPLPLRGSLLAPNYSLHLLINIDKSLGDDGTLSQSGSALYLDTTEYTLILQ
ncbi:MAG: hypothetical protein ACYCW6_25615 [Candidatus Xenobia bacterium]